MVRVSRARTGRPEFAPKGRPHTRRRPLTSRTRPATGSATPPVPMKRPIPMKLVAIAGRGSRKDFIDLYAYFEAGGDFPGLIQILRQRYAATSFNEVHLLRSLVYFEDAEQEPMPRTLREISWPKVRRRLEDEVRRWAP